VTPRISARSAHAVKEFHHGLLGRGVEPYDQPAVERIVTDLQANDGKFSTLIFGVVDSVPFQMRRSDVSSDAAQARADGITR